MDGRDVTSFHHTAGSEPALALEGARCWLNRSAPGFRHESGAAHEKSDYSRVAGGHACSRHSRTKVAATDRSMVATRPGHARCSSPGDFNAWDSTATPMVPRSGGNWQVRLNVVPGLYRYNFVIDGKWVCDRRHMQP